MGSKQFSLAASGVTVNSSFPITALGDMLGEAARTLAAQEDGEGQYPLTVQVKREGIGSLKVSVARHPEHETALGVAKEPLGNGLLMVGNYVPTDRFGRIPEHTAVMNAVTQELVAVTGPAHDPESEAVARLFASSQVMAGLLRVERAIRTDPTLRSEGERRLVDEVSAAASKMRKTVDDYMCSLIELALHNAGQHFLP